MVMDEYTLAKFRKRYSTVFTKAHELKSACADHLRISIVMERVDDGTIYHWNSDPRITRKDGSAESWPPAEELMFTDGERLKNMSPEVLGRERARRLDRRLSRRAGTSAQIDDDDAFAAHSSDFLELSLGFEEEEHDGGNNAASEPRTPEDLGEDAFDVFQDNFEQLFGLAPDAYNSDLLQTLVESYPVASGTETTAGEVPDPQKLNASQTNGASNRASSIARTRMANLDLYRGQSSKRPAASPVDQRELSESRGRQMEPGESQGIKNKRLRSTRSNQITIPSAIALPESPMHSQNREVSHEKLSCQLSQTAMSILTSIAAIEPSAVANRWAGWGAHSRHRLNQNCVTGGSRGSCHCSTAADTEAQTRMKEREWAMYDLTTTKAHFGLHLLLFSISL
ncbi:uncharacterized protein MYCFIDRAFT_173894 [Pseudocercospora fijiensis CIRAD86]|uniref:MADS-box domain-containing protein n=1 Tax=Pseudocercospora fijiensis (strain CIRAD86) TaxID=383855 RepID=M3B6P7_PSEFD|nr:uncharacterized protein MYCFIDRAFT_173894 [Pseudocercospora fijiensis CIRAD86]EME85022.1 hypothetical protein MYCFIDRAFT_173894 [Pseudocercospora fijiensis CIRAD86]